MMPPVAELTDNQLEAVRHAGGPLIVLAGPGTGKTRTIIARVAHQIQERGLEPESIVALTFTVKAAAQMRERLARHVGPLMADRVNVSTIHGFGHKLVRRFSDMLELPPELEMVDAAQSHRLMTEVILTQGLFPFSRAAGVRSLIGELGGIFAGIANRGLSVRQCGDFVKQWAARLKQMSAGDDLQAELTRCAYFRDAVLALHAYNDIRWKRGWMTYDDFLTLPLRLLRENAAAATLVRADYRAFVVDEFQDCNPAQIDFLRLLAPPKGSPDLCVVGDDDQAIYRFRGADEQAFRRFESIWPNPRVVALTENYRSQPTIIVCANAVIRRAQSRFRPDKEIGFPKGRAPLPAGESGVEAVKVEDRSQEPEVIAAMIAADRLDTALAGRSRALERYAVIARSHKDLDSVAAALRLEGIPYQRVRSRDVLDDAGVDDVLAWIEWLTDPGATWAARRVLTRPPFGLLAEDALAWELEFGAQRSQHAIGRDGVEDPGRFHEWLRGRAVEYPALGRALALHATLLGEVASMRADEAVFRIVSATDAAHAELLPGRDRAGRVAALVSLIGLARDKQRRLEPPGDLAEFWRYYQELRGAGATVVADIEGITDQPEAEEGEAEGGVQLLTAHSSKGLEFDTVFVPRVNPPHGYPKARGSHEWEPPEGLFNDLDGRSVAERSADEERRLFYVACTRAERRLVVLSKPNKDPSGAVNFFEELTRGGPLPVSVHHAAHILKDAAARGAVPGTALEAAGVNFKGRATARRAAERARREARLGAAQALEMVERADATPEQVERASEALRRAAEQIALTAGAQVGRPPAWLLQQRPDLRPLSDKLVGMLRQSAGADERGALSLIQPMKPPLKLSYTMLHDYQACPRCFYLKNVLRMPERHTDEKGLGTLAHAALKVFYDRWVREDSEGLFKPGVEPLVSVAQDLYLSSLGPSQRVDQGVLDQLLAQMRNLWSNLHANTDHVLETERTMEFDYPLDGHTHRFTAKLDRIDLLPDGGVRVIDYKTGYAAKRYLEPQKDDLQMGIYALALKHSKASGWAGGEVRGVAEYWCLSKGERGTIPLSELDEARVRAQIDEAVRGMLKGEFPCGKDCGGPCTLFSS
jgi:DNA helicase-2/ATP-dependent DNA helicase PcrA